MVLKRNILVLLIENKDKTFTIREISKLLKKDYKNTYDAVQRLRDSITASKQGNSTFIGFRPAFTLDAISAEGLRRQRVKPKIRTILKDIDSMENPFFTAVLFGSYAKGSETKGSDIDICILHDNHAEEKRIRTRLSLNPKVHLESFSYAEFTQMISSRKFNVGHEIVRHGIVLNNLESYYRIIKDGGQDT